MSRYQLHGLTLAAPFALPALPAPAAAAADFSVIHEQSAQAWPDTDGELLASSSAAGASYRIVASPSGLYCVYPGLGELLFTADRQLRLRIGRDDVETAAALVSGSALAAWLVAKGQLVLHASAVAWPDLSLAIVGASHSGKTTLAAQCALAGARLLTDDVLRLSLDDAEVSWFAGARWLRLRTGSEALRHGWGECYRSARDERWVVSATGADVAARGRLDALVLPSFGATDKVGVTRLSSAEVLRRLVLLPRVRGLRAAELLREQLELTARLARSVPCFQVKVPLGPPFLPETAQAVRSELLRLLATPLDR